MKKVRNIFVMALMAFLYTGCASIQYYPESISKMQVSELGKIVVMSEWEKNGNSMYLSWKEGVRIQEIDGIKFWSDPPGIAIVKTGSTIYLEPGEHLIKVSARIIDTYSYDRANNNFKYLGSDKAKFTVYKIEKEIKIYIKKGYKYIIDYSRKEPYIFLVENKIE